MTMHRPQFTLKTLLWLTVVVAAFFGGIRFDRYLADTDPKESSIRAALAEKTELDFAEQPLTDVIEYLKQRHEIEIQLDNKALTDAGVNTDTPITRSIKGITLRSALNLLLDELDLTYVIRNGVLTITSKTEAESGLFSLTMILWIILVVAVLLGGIQLDRAWRHRAEQDEKQPKTEARPHAVPETPPSWTQE